MRKAKFPRKYMKFGGFLAEWRLIDSNRERSFARADQTPLFLAVLKYTVREREHQRKLPRPSSIISKLGHSRNGYSGTDRSGSLAEHSIDRVRERCTFFLTAWTYTFARCTSIVY